MLISVIIVSRNRLKLLRRALESIAAQNDQNIEIVIVDNNSDERLDLSGIAANLPQIKILRNESILPASAARNVGMAAVQGDVVCFLDDDDVYLPGKFADVRAALNTDDTLDFCYGSTNHEGANGVHLCRSDGPPEIIPFLRWRYVHLNALALRRRVAETHRFDEEMSTFEDVDFVGRLLLRAKGKHISNDHAIWYRDGRQDQLTQRNWRRSHANWKILCKTFSNQIDSDRHLRRAYHRKALALSLRFGDLSQAVRSMAKLLGIGLVVRS